MNTLITHVVTFKYDLGGPVNVAKGSNLGFSVTDYFDTAVYNLSYLASRDLPLLLSEEVLFKIQQDTLPGILIKAQIKKRNVRKITRESWLYPQGVLSIDYCFEFADISFTSVLKLMELLPEEKNIDYIPYLLKRISTGERSGLEAISAKNRKVDTCFYNNTDVLKRAENQVVSLVNPRPYRYIFHDYRQLIFVRTFDVGKISGKQVTSFLKTATTMQYGDVHSEDYESVVLAGTNILAGRWVSSALVNANAPLEAEKRIKMFINHVHNSWYLCQAWIFAIDDYIQKTRDAGELSDEAIQNLHKIRQQMGAYQTSLEHDISEIFDVDVIVKDYPHTKFLIALFKAFNLYTHYDLLSRRKNELDRQHSLVTNIITERFENEQRRTSLMLEYFFTAIAIFSIGEVMFDFLNSTTETDFIVGGLLLTCFCIFLFLRIRRKRRR